MNSHGERNKEESTLGSTLSISTTLSFSSPPLPPPPPATPEEEIMFDQMACALVPYDRREFVSLISEQARAAYHARFEDKSTTLEPWPQDAAYHIMRLILRLLNIRIAWSRAAECTPHAWFVCKKKWMNQLIRDGCRGLDIELTPIINKVVALYESNTLLPSNDICVKYLCRYTFETVMKKLSRSDQIAFNRRKEVFIKNFCVCSSELGRVMLMLRSPPPCINDIPKENVTMPPILKLRSVNSIDSAPQDTDEVDG
jgi:hypothetical protein